ncbi:hypothetical protein [Rhizobium sp. Leaf341]|uniref:hypothetical protein n=1 Tax=Rhizobium sp. Leaf341 TaxID=1736344 RepID=UPI000715AAF4|nr:hypothetical protein [Rhizobium sp. Leaf341]KQR67864.1 hypothetical protein ASG03_10110 [Rhizobium sp. Leaf341]
MPSWEPQKDGTFLPSAELMERVRANPQKYPNAVADFSKITGKTEEEVQAIFDNPGSSGFWGTIAGTAVDVGQGAIKATAVAAENLVPEEYLGDTGKDIAAYGESLDPKFETEKSVGESLAEGVGQALPVVGATVGTGGWAGLLAGAGVATLTFEDEQNLANTLEEVAPGVTPDILVVKPEDDELTATSKALVTNILTDAVFMGATHVVGKAIRALSRGATPEEIKVLAKEAEAAIADTATPYTEAKVISQTAARKRLLSQVEMREKVGQSIAPAVKDPAERKVFHESVWGAFKKLSDRSADTNPGLDLFHNSRKADLTSYADNVMDRLAQGDAAGLVQVLTKGVKANDAVEAAYVNTFQNSVLKVTLEKLNDSFDETVRLLREDPSLQTKAAFRETMSAYQDTVADIGEVYRLYGSSASYQLLTRKGVIPAGGFEEVLAAEQWVKETVKDTGFDLFSDKVEFVSAQALKWDSLGIDAAKVLPELDDMFAKFDIERQGVLANLGQNATSKMSPEQRMGAMASFVRMVKDIQSTALLGQLSTTGLNVASDTLNNVLLPFLEHGLAKGNFKRAGTEYAGYAAALKTSTAIAKKAFLSGKGVLDDFDLMDGAHSSVLDYENLSGMPRLMVRLFKFATDLSLASSEFWKSTRAFGLAYADGLELALKSGQGRVEAKRIARQYAQDQFDASGALTNAMYRNDVSRTSWQQAFDTRYVTGRLAQAVDNVRNRDDAVGLLARAGVPFFRTIVNIGSDSLQYIVPPGLPAALRVMAKGKQGGWLQDSLKVIKALDDFSGNNGAAAQARAIGRHRMGMALTATALGAVALHDNVEITGASGLKRWDAKKRAFEEYPPNSIIINGVSTDLNRLMPFSAPLMLAGMMRDMEIENELQMKDGNFASDNGPADALVNFAPALAYTTLTLFQDSAAMQGVFDLSSAFDEAISEGKPDALVKYGQKYLQQFTPGTVKMAAKSTNLDQYEGFDFFTNYAAAAGFPVGFKRLDFLGEPITFGVGRGLDPLNMKNIDNESGVRKEFIFLNKTDGLALVPPKPDAVFDKAFWKALGVDTGNAFSSGKMPSLVTLKTTTGKNGWDAYRAYLYQGRLSSNKEVPTASQGDRVDIGKVLIKKGENFQDAVTRLVETRSYQGLTPDARAKVWNAVFGYFKKQAKDQLSDEIVVDPEVFEGSRYGSPIKRPTTLSDTEGLAETLGAGIQQTKGSPLDAAFEIKK